MKTCLGIAGRGAAVSETNRSNVSRTQAANMNFRGTRHSTKAFTLLELMAVICAIGVVAFFLFMPRLNSGCKAKAPQINCVNNLKQVGLSFRLWAGDHGDKFPMQVSVADGGTMERSTQGVVFPHFTMMSNELGVPKIVACPADKKRTVATNFVSLADANVSYFVCLNARDGSNPEMWLAGDWNV